MASRFYQASVPDQSGQILANAIGQAFQTYRQGRFMKQQQERQQKAEQEAREAQDLTLSLQGIQRGTAPMEAAVPMPRMEGGKIVGVDAAPDRYEQLTPAFFRDTQVVERNRREASQAAFQNALSAALAQRQAGIMADPQGHALSQRKTLAEIQRLENPEPKAPVRLSTVTTDEGVFTFNPVTGERGNRLGARPRPQRAAGGGQGRQGGPPTEGERKALFFYRRAEPAQQIIGGFDNIKTLDDLAGKAGRFGNWAKTPQGRQLYQAGQVWAMAVLRQDSGGAITPEEMEGYFDTYLPRPGDDDATLAQKREARRVVTEGLRELAGRALPADMAPDARGDTGTVTVNGKTYQIPER